MCVRDEPPSSLLWRFDGVEEGQGGRGGRRARRASQAGQERAAEHKRRCLRIVSCALLSAPVLRVRNKLPVSWLLVFRGRGEGWRGDRGTMRA